MMDCNTLAHYLRQLDLSARATTTSAADSVFVFCRRWKLLCSNTELFPWPPWVVRDHAVLFAVAGVLLAARQERCSPAPSVGAMPAAATYYVFSMRGAAGPHTRLTLV